MPDKRIIAFQDRLNRTLNKTVTHARLRAVALSPSPRFATITYFDQTARHAFSAVPLQNGCCLSIRMDIRVVPNGVTTEATSIAYRCPSSNSSDDWIFRYEYERARAEAGDYRYPVAHLHVNATPLCYRGVKAFPDLHLPTRRLSLEAILRHLIVEHDVPVLGDRDAALTFLDEQQADFERRRTDPEKPFAAVTTNILFVCPQNADRGQMAAAFLAEIATRRRLSIQADSAGRNLADRVNPAIIAAMDEVGIDLSGAQPKRATDQTIDWADWIITMDCELPLDDYPSVARRRIENWTLSNPPGEKVTDVRRLRDVIRERVGTFVDRRLSF